MRRIVLMVTGALVMALMMAVAGPASAAASGPASCMGREASNISPPGSSEEEFPGGMPGFGTFIRDNFPGIPSGAIYSQIAKLHEGSHEDCDEATE